MFKEQQGQRPRKRKYHPQSKGKDRTRSFSKRDQTNKVLSVAIRGVLWVVGVWLLQPACCSAAREPGEAAGEVEMPLLREGDELILVKDGKPAAGIIVAGNASDTVMEHAQFLQKTIEEMTGVQLPLRDDSRDWKGAQILVGPSKLNDVTVPQGFKRPEGYRVVVNGRKVSLVGNDAGERVEGTTTGHFEGTGYAVYDFLQELGCGWFGPDPLYQVVPERKTLAVRPMDRREEPAFAFRDIGPAFSLIKDAAPQVQFAWRLGGVGMWLGHNFDALFPLGQYYDDHPEYYSLIDGKRLREVNQLCFSNPDVQRITIEKVREYFDKTPGYQVAYSVAQNDAGGFCECENCAKLGTNPSAQMLSFANIVGRGIAKTHPGKLVGFQAYWFTWWPPEPPMKSDPNVVVLSVNQGCHAHNVDDPRCPFNKHWMRPKFEGWVATGVNMLMYEWYIPAHGQTKDWSRLPWISPDVAFRNLRYWRSMGAQWAQYETGMEEGTGYPRRWPLYYLAARGLWNPDDDPNEILREACERLYGDAAEPMLRYFTTLARAMKEAHVHRGGSGLPPPDLIYTTEVVAEVRDALDKARSAVSEDVPSGQRVAKEIELWQQSEEILETLPYGPQQGWQMLDARAVNRGVWWTEKFPKEGDWIRTLVGIGSNEVVSIVLPDGKKRLLVDSETYAITGPSRIVPHE